MKTKSLLLTAIGLTVSISSISQTTPVMKNININAPVKCTRTIVINARPERVWAIMTNIDHWPTWQKDIAKAKINGPLTPGTTFNWKTGGAGIHSTLHTVDALKRIGWDGKAFGTRAIHNWVLMEVDGRTQLTVEESMEGFLVAVFKKAFNKNLETGMTTWMELLKKEAE